MGRLGLHQVVHSVLTIERLLRSGAPVGLREVQQRCGLARPQTAGAYLDAVAAALGGVQRYRRGRTLAWARTPQLELFTRGPEEAPPMHAERPLALRVTERRARRAHRCCECDEPIPPGARYRYTSGVWAGGVGAGSFKQCLSCAAVWDEVQGWVDADQDHLDALPAFTELWVWIAEALWEEPALGGLRRCDACWGLGVLESWTLPGGALTSIRCSGCAGSGFLIPAGQAAP